MYRYQPGSNVRILTTGAIGTINAVLEREGNPAYRVTVEGRTVVYQEKFLEPFVDTEQQVLSQLESQEASDAEAFRLFHTKYRLRKPLEGSYYSYLASKTLFNPYQFKPLIKFLSPGSEDRLFIADEVGVGKTIEAGIILTELLARERLDNRSGVLIVCPNTLGPKWQKEMQERFNLDFHVHDGRSLAYTLKSALEQRSLPEKFRWGIAGLQLIRGERYLELLRQLSVTQDAELFNMLIVDEAHHMRNPSTLSNEIGNVLSGLCEMVLMLSATPLNLRDDDLFNQMHILNPGLFPDADTFTELLAPVKSLNRCRRLLTSGDTHLLREEMRLLEQSGMGAAYSAHPGWRSLRTRLDFPFDLAVQEKARFDRIFTSLSPLDSSFTRTLKREAFEHRVIREAIKVPVELSEREQAFHDRVIELTLQAYEERGGHPYAGGFVTNVPKRMVSSCIPAMHQYIDWCLERDAMLDTYFSDEEFDDDSDVPVIPMSEETRLAFLELKNEALLLGEDDTKYHHFLSILRRLQGELANPQVMVFSFFVRTLYYLRKRLIEDGFRVGLICGSVPLVSDGQQPGRYEIMESFKNGEFDILLSSEVGGEGLDFQFCQAMINYDLPYNPMRVEQRIGRIDRFGQKAEKVMVASMYITGTVDEVIYERLYERIRLVEDSVGSLEPILGRSFLDLHNDILTGRLSEEQIAHRMRDMELAVEQAKLEMQQFEQGRQELLGEDRFEEMFSNLTTTNNFVGPADIASLSRHVLSRSPGCSFVQLDDDRARLGISADLRQKVEAFLRKPGNELGYRELQPLLRSPETDVLFNGSLAHQFPEYAFIPACGAWARFLFAELDNEGELGAVFNVSCAKADVSMDEGRYLVPLFEVETEGIRKELRLAAVPFSTSSRKVAHVDFVETARTIARAGQSVSASFWNSEQDYGEVVELCRSHVEVSLDSYLEELRAEYAFRREARVQSLRNAARAKTGRLRNRIADHADRARQSGESVNSDFIRMTEAQIKAENSRAEEKIRRLQAKSDVSISVSLIAVVNLLIY